MKRYLKSIRANLTIDQLKTLPKLDIYLFSNDSTAYRETNLSSTQEMSVKLGMMAKQIEVSSF